MSGYQLPIWVWPTALLSVCALAAWRGRDPERLAAGGYLAAWALTVVVFKDRTDDIQWAVMLIDAMLLVLMVGLALQARRFWPLFVGAFQLLAVLTHVARALDGRISGWAYLTAVLVWGYLAMATIGYAAWTAPRRYAEIDALEASEPPGATRR